MIESGQFLVRTKSVSACPPYVRFVDFDWLSLCDSEINER